MIDPAARWVRSADGSRIRMRVHALKEGERAIGVGDPGFVDGVELRPREGAPGARVRRRVRRVLSEGAMVRYAGDVVACLPPFVIAGGAEGRALYTIAAAVLKETTSRGK